MFSGFYKVILFLCSVTVTSSSYAVDDKFCADFLLRKDMDGFNGFGCNSKPESYYLDWINKEQQKTQRLNNTEPIIVAAKDITEFNANKTTLTKEEMTSFLKKMVLKSTLNSGGTGLTWFEVKIDNDKQYISIFEREKLNVNGVGYLNIAHFRVGSIKAIYSTGMVELNNEIVYYRRSNSNQLKDFNYNLKSFEFYKHYDGAWYGKKYYDIPESLVANFAKLNYIMNTKKFSGTITQNDIFSPDALSKIDRFQF